jgi:hypothetical protein
MVTIAANAALAAALCVVSGAQEPHSIQFWRPIVEHDFAVPEGGDIGTLTIELAELLASSDPELRDDVGYSTLAAWIYRKQTVGPETVRALAARLRQNLTHGIGEQGTDGVFRRSFSALVLAAIVARDNATPFFTPDEFRGIQESALTYLASERDLRGYDVEKGWMHSAAHTADLLRFLGRSRHLDVRGQARILNAIAQKLTDAGAVFTHGEDERFARAVLSLINRPDFDRDGFQAWATRAKPAGVTTARPTPAQLAASQNVKNLFAKLEVLLSMDAQPSESATLARDALRAALKGTF